MKYLIDLSTLESAGKGMSPYAVSGSYLREAEHSGTEGLTQLIDIGRLANLIVLSEKLLTSSKNPCSSSYFSNLPIEIQNMIVFVSLEKNSDYWEDQRIHKEDIESLQNRTKHIEKLLGMEIVVNFIDEIHKDFTEEDFQYVTDLAGRLSLGSRTRLRNKVFSKLVCRTFQYLQTADVLSTAYVCHAYRSPIVRAFHPRITKLNYDIYHECERKVVSWLNQVTNEDHLELRFPMFFLYILKEANSVEDIFTIARQFREQDEIKTLHGALDQFFCNNTLNLKKYVELRQILDEQGRKFRDSFGLIETESDSGLSLELSVSPTSIFEIGVSIDLFKLPKALPKAIRNNLFPSAERKSIAAIFNYASNVYGTFSLENDINRIWQVSLGERPKNLLREILELVQR